MLRRRTEHQSAYAIGVPTPTEFRDGPAHGISDRNELVDAERVRHGDDIVCTIRQSKPTRRDPLAMAAVIDRHDMVALGKIGKSGKPVQRPGGAQAMEQHQRGGCLRTPVLDHAGTAPALQVQVEGLTVFFFCWHRNGACRPYASSASRPR